MTAWWESQQKPLETKAEIRNLFHNQLNVSYMQQLILSYLAQTY